MWPPLADQTFGASLRREISYTILRSVLTHTKPLPPVVGVVTLNNKFLLLKNANATARLCITDLVRRLHQLTELENSRGEHCTHAFPPLGPTAALIHLGEGVEVIPWFQELLSLSVSTFKFAGGTFTISWEPFQPATELPRLTPTLAPLLIAPSETSEADDIAVDCSQWSFWASTLSPASVKSTRVLAAMCAYLGITSSVRSFLAFGLGGAPVPYDADIPYIVGPTITRAWMQCTRERLFHDHATATLAAFQRMLFPMIFGDADSRPCTMHFPAHFGPNMCSFDVVVDPGAWRGLMGRWKCLEVRALCAVRFALTDVCGPQMPPSPLGDVLAKLVPCLMGRRVPCPPLAEPVAAPFGTSSYLLKLVPCLMGRRALTEPVAVPFGTSPYLLGLAVHLRLVECGCIDCLEALLFQTWTLGEGLDSNVASIACHGARLLQGDVTSGPVLVERDPLLQSVLAAVAPEGAKYLEMARFYISEPQTIFSAIDVLFKRVRFVCGIDNPRFPLMRNELRLHSRIRFVWERSVKRHRAL
jgi:hypothetical protein